MGYYFRFNRKCDHFVKINGEGLKTPLPTFILDNARFAWDSNTSLNYLIRFRRTPSYSYRGLTFCLSTPPSILLLKRYLISTSNLHFLHHSIPQSGTINHVKRKRKRFFSANRKEAIMAKEMTRIEALNAAIEGNLTPEVVAKLKAMVDQLSKPVKKTETAEDRERAALVATAVETVKSFGEPVTTSWLMEHVKGIDNSQKAGAIMSIAIREGLIVKAYNEKGRPVYQAS